VLPKLFTFLNKKLLLKELLVLNRANKDNPITRCLIYSDETWVEIGHPRHASNISCPREANRLDYCTQSFKPSRVRIKFWDCMAYEYQVPCVLWEKESKDERVYYNGILEIENNAKRRRQEEHRTRAVIEGTEEYQHLQDLNAN